MSNLKALVTEQITLLKTLKQQLESELHLVSTRDAEALTSLVNEKAATLELIAKQDRLIEAAYQADLAVSLRPLFDQAKTLLNECKYCTEINAKAVEQGQLRLEHLRNLLLEARAKESMTYDKTGKARGSLGSKGITA